MKIDEQKAMRLLTAGIAVSAHAVGATGSPCRQCGSRFRDVDCVLPFEGEAVHEYCFPGMKHAANPSLEFARSHDL